MEGNDKNMEKSDKSPKTEIDIDATSVFTQEEIKTIVKEFIAAYIRQDVIISFPTAQELMRRAEWAGKRLDVDTALSQELQGKEPVLGLIEICAGTKQASSEQRNKAITDLFEAILGFRSSHRLKGKFMVFDAEKRLAKLEKDLDETNKLVAELLITVKTLLEKKG